MLNHPVFCRLKKLYECPWKGPLSKLEVCSQYSFGAVNPFSSKVNLKLPHFGKSVIHRKKFLRTVLGCVSGNIGKESEESLCLLLQWREVWLCVSLTHHIDKCLLFIKPWKLNPSSSVMFLVMSEQAPAPQRNNTFCNYYLWGSKTVWQVCFMTEVQIIEALKLLRNHSMFTIWDGDGVRLNWELQKGPTWLKTV